jgi:hypothetical protein
MYLHKCIYFLILFFSLILDETFAGGVVGIVVIASDTGTEDRGFESRQGLRFLVLYSLKRCSL